jgi:DNA-binding NarL/FixJ family response regulator
MFLHILIIDNDPHNELLASRLRAEDCEVTIVHQPHRVGRWVRQGGFDGIIVNPALFPQFTCEALVDYLHQHTSDRTPILLLTATGSLATCRGCWLLHETAIDCVDMPADADEIVARLFSLVRHGKALPATPAEGHTIRLSPREREVLTLLRGGLSNREAAERLFITEKVVEKHITHICQKLGVANRTEAVGLSYRKKLV